MSNQLRLGDLIPGGAGTAWAVPAYHQSVGRHSHDYYELVYIREGFCLHDVDGRTALLMEGDLFAIGPGTPHRYIGNRVVSLFNCMFTGEAPGARLLLARGEIDFLDGGGRFTPMRLDLAERKLVSRRLTEMCAECADRPSGWADKLDGLLRALLIDCARMRQARGGGERDQGYSAYVARALLDIHERYADDLSVGGIAEGAGVSPDYLTRQFKRALGIAPLEYLRRYRFARAMELLQSGDSVTDAAAKVGYRSLCHFSREFKKSLGIAPSQYRSQNHEGGTESWH
ncbi:MAG: AraC family transcriptional regulator [Clostridiales bacterium]|nr:AraC family transcriptional regulator [Clostridiales bacterium]